MITLQRSRELSAKVLIHTYQAYKRSDLQDTYFAGIATQNAGGEPMVLRVYAQRFGQMSGVSVPRSLWWRLPASYIANSDYLTAPISGLEHWSQIKFNPYVYHLLTVLH